MKNKRSHIILLFLAMALFSWSQQENRLIRQGNREYNDSNYKEAEIDYIKSLQSGKPTHKGFFNLGNTWYMQENYLQAAGAFDTLRTFKLDDDTRSKSYYNLGNSMLKAALDSAQLAQELLPSTIEAYKQSLRLNPEDTDAKYNLAYAQKLLRESEQQQQQQNQQQNQENQEEEQQEQQQNQEQQNQEQEQQQQQQQQQEQQQQQQQQTEQQEISKEDAERILEALKNDEKQTLEKLKQAKIQSMRVIKSDKDW
jgi:hypothetical protein